MKEAKKTYESLVEKLKSGENVSFGQMEKNVFAPAFLEAFLERLLGGQERARLQDLHKQAVFGSVGETLAENGINESDVELTSNQLLKQEIELVRLATSVIGVRPSTSQLSPYISEALKRRDWEMVSNVLSLSQEGKLERGTIESVALEELIRGRTESYQVVKQRFPDLQFSTEMVQPAYQEIIKQRAFENLKVIKEETGVPVPQEAIQKGYDLLISELGNKEAFSERRRDMDALEIQIDNLKRLKDNSGVPVPKTEELKQKIAQVFSQPIESHHQEMLEGVIPIYEDNELSIIAQKSAMGARNVDAFLYAYNRAENKVSKDEIQKLQDEFAKNKDRYSVMSIIKGTNTAPSSETWKALCSNLLQKRELKSIEEIVSRFNIKPVFDEQVLREEASNFSRSIGTIKSYIGLIGKVGKDVKQELLDEMVMKYMANSSSLDVNISSINSLYEEVNLRKSDDVANMQASVLARKFKTGVESSVASLFKGDVSPLQPAWGNTKEYKELVKKTRELMKGTISDIQEIKRSNPQTNIDPIQAQNAYQPSLQVILCQAQRSEKTLNLNNLVEATGIPLSHETFVRALTNHVQTNYHSPSEAEGFMDRIRNAGIELSLTEEDKLKIADKIFESSKNVYPAQVLNGVKYLQGIFGSVPKSENLDKRIKDSAVEALCDHNNPTNYDSLMGFTNPDSLSENHLYMLKRKAVRELDQGNIDIVDNIQNRSKVLDSKDIEDSAVKALNSWQFNIYDSVQRHYNVKIELTPERANEIRGNAIQKVLTNPSEINNVEEITKRTGLKITATPQELKDIVQTYFNRGNHEPSKIATALNQKLDERQVEDEYVHLLAINSWDSWQRAPVERAKELLKDTNVIPSKKALDSLVERATNIEVWKGLPSNQQPPKESLEYGLAVYERIAKLVPDYKPEKNVTEWMFNHGDTRIISKLMGMTGEEPSQSRKDEVIKNAFDRAFNLNRDNWNYLDEEVMSLASKFVSPEYELTPIRNELRNKVMQDPGKLLGNAYKLANRAARISENAITFDKEEQRKLLEALDRDVSNNSGTTLGYWLGEGYGYQGFYENAPKIASRIFTDPEVQKLAGERAAQILSEEHVFKSYAFVALSGTNPLFTPEQYKRFVDNFGSQGRRLRASEHAYMNSHKESWKPKEVA